MRMLVLSNNLSSPLSAVAQNRVEEGLGSVEACIHLRHKLHEDVAQSGSKTGPELNDGSCLVGLTLPAPYLGAAACPLAQQ